MKKRNRGAGKEISGEEFAFDLTPDVTDGKGSRMHRERSRTVSNPGASGAAPGRVEEKGMDDVEQGPSVKGHHFSVT